MKTGYKIVITLIITWGGLMGLSQLYDFALLQNCNLKASFVQQTKIDADVLIHGPCVPLWMINPEQIEQKTNLKTYNLALSHSDFADNYLHLYLYLKHNKAPRYLFLYVTPESMDLTNNALNSFRFAPYLNDPIVDTVIRELDPGYYKWSWIPFMKYAYYSNNVNFDAAQGLKHYFTHKKFPAYANGYEPPFAVVWDNSLEKFIQQYPNGYNFIWNDFREKYLRKTIELAQQHGVKVYLYESPVLKEALAYMPNRKELVNKIKTIAENYAIDYLQFENMQMATTRNYFFSTLNTTLKGSVIFTDTLITCMKKTIL